MAKAKQPVKEVLSVIDKCSKMYATCKEEDFNQSLLDMCCYGTDNSPIEQMLYCAVETVRRVTSLPSIRPELVNGEWHPLGFTITPQFQIDKYRVDFLVSYSKPVKCDTDILENRVVVECDSQQFHERTEKERRYEKARDRYLYSKGYTVFHFTGKEIIEDPFKVACEVVAVLTCRDAKGILEWVSEYK